MAEDKILSIEEMSEIISILKTFKGINIEQKLGFFQSLLAGYSMLTWENIIKDSNNESITKDIIKAIQINYLRNKNSTQ